MHIPSTMHQLKRQRLDASVYTHTAAVGLLLGVQMFIDGTGRAPGMALSAVALASLSAPLCAVLLCLLINHLRSRHEMASLPDVYIAVLGRFVGATACILTALLLLLDALGAIAMLGTTVTVRILPAQPIHTVLLPALVVVLTVVFVSGEGMERLAYLSRHALPVLLLLLSYWIIRKEPVSNLFPLLGRSLVQTGKSALMSTGAAACTLCLGFLPACARTRPPVFRTTGLRELLTGGTIGFVMLLFVAMSAPLTIMEGTRHWAEWIVHAGTHSTDGGIFHLPILLLQCFALLLALGASLFFALRALSRVIGLWPARIVLCVFTLLAAIALGLCGNAFVFALLPVRFLPALALLLITLIVDCIRARRAKGGSAA